MTTVIAVYITEFDRTLNRASCVSLIIVVAVIEMGVAEKRRLGE